MYISPHRPAAGALPRMPQSAAGGTLSEQAPEAASASPLVPPEEYMRQAERFVNELKAKFGEDFNGGEGKEALIVSDIIDDAGHQYVNLVQKGGGVLGIALVGYTHVLEQAGIRFVRMAGTSAGAINTALFTAIGDASNPKAEAKSGRLLGYLSRLEMFSFVDGHPFAKWLIRNFISDKNFSKRVTSVITAIGVIQLLLIAASFLLLGLEKVWDWEYDSALTRVSFVATGLCFLLVLSLGSYASRMFSRLRNSGYGINPGDTFLNWIKERLDENGAGTIEDLERKASTLPADLKMRDGRPPGTLEADVTFITSELVTQNKIEFPKMWNLFRAPEEKGDLHPGEFVRASMSIPFFFESHIISDIPTQNAGVRKAWEDTFACKAERVPNVARFVDGGVLSNFPINIFYNPAVAEARLPSFGIDLDDADPKADRGGDAVSWTIGSYCMRMLNTIRFYYDKDFLLKNAVFARGVGSVKLHDRKFNWLDFFLSDKTKMELFLKGAEAARDFLLQFDWERYKEERRKMHQQIHPERVAPLPTEPPVAIVSNPATLLTPPVF